MDTNICMLAQPDVQQHNGLAIEMHEWNMDEKCDIIK